MKKPRFTWAGVLALCVLSVPSVGQESYDGRFAAGLLALSLEQTGSSVAGEIVIRGKSGKVTASVLDGRLRGDFEYEGRSFPFAAVFEDPTTPETLVVTSSGQSHLLVRTVVPDNPLADPGLSVGIDPFATRQPPPASDARPAQRNRPQAALPQVLALDSGISVRYPAGWKAETLGVITTLFPPNRAGSIAPLSTYWVITVPMASIDMGDSQALAMLINNALTGLLSDVTREGEIDLIGTTALEGIHLRFTATSMLDAPLELDVMARPTTKGLLVLAGMGDPDELESNTTMVKRIVRGIEVKP